MKLASRDRTLLLTIGAPGTGFALTLDGAHLWLFDRDGNIAGSFPPAEGSHLPVARPDSCPGCVDFVLRNYGTS